MNGQRSSRHWKFFLCGAFFVVGAIIFARAQEPPSTTPPAASPAPSPAAKNAGKKYSHKNDFLIRGTVFNEKALSFPGVQVRIRIAGEKKYRWETYTNSRGDFAVRVQQGLDYEMLVHAKGFADQTRSLDAKMGDNEETVVFRMEPVAGGKK